MLDTRDNISLCLMKYSFCVKNSAITVVFVSKQSLSNFGCAVKTYHTVNNLVGDVCGSLAWVVQGSSSSRVSASGGVAGSRVSSSRTSKTRVLSGETGVVLAKAVLLGGWHELRGGVVMGLLGGRVELGVGSELGAIIRALSRWDDWVAVSIKWYRHVELLSCVW